MPYPTILLGLLIAPHGVDDQLRPGEQLNYSGTLVERSADPTRFFSRTQTVEVRHLILHSDPLATDYARLVILCPVAEASLVRLAQELALPSGWGERPEPSLSFNLLRSDPHGLVKQLQPKAEPPPLDLSARTLAVRLPPPPADDPIPEIFGPFPAPGGSKSATASPAWVQRFPNGGEMHWQPDGLITMDGAETVVWQGVQHSPGWPATQAAEKSWKRVDRVWVATVDGLVRRLERCIELHHGPRPDRVLELKLDLQAAPRLSGDAFAQQRREIEFAWWFQREAVQRPSAERAALAVRIRQYCETTPETPYRQAVLAALRRAELIP